jgi:hypothetical protein
MPVLKIFSEYIKMHWNNCGKGWSQGICQVLHVLHFNLLQYRSSLPILTRLIPNSNGMQERQDQPWKSRTTDYQMEDWEKLKYLQSIQMQLLCKGSFSLRLNERSFWAIMSQRLFQKFQDATNATFSLSMQNWSQELDRMRLKEVQHSILKPWIFNVEMHRNVNQNVIS